MTGFWENFYQYKRNHQHVRFLFMVVLHEVILIFQFLAILWAAFLDKEHLLMPAYYSTVSLLDDTDSCAGGGRELIGAVVC